MMLLNLRQLQVNLEKISALKKLQFIAIRRVYWRALAVVRWNYAQRGERRFAVCD